MKLTSLLFASTALLFPVTVRSQQISCVHPAGCTLKVTSDTARQYLTVSVTDRNGNPFQTRVTFEVVKGAGSVTKEVPTDGNGLATTMWMPAAANPYPAEIRVSAPVGADNPVQTLQLTFTRTTGWTLSPHAANSGNNQRWYEDRQLRHPVRVEIRGVGADLDCRRAAVAFRPIGGGVSAPDTVYGTWRADSAQQCVAHSWWRLPKGVGTHALRANLTGEPAKNLTFNAIARALPRVVIGLAGYRTHSFTEVETTADTIQVTRELPGQNTTITYDSIFEASEVQDREAEEVFAPTIGVDFPIFAATPLAERIRMSLATSMRDPDENLFVGLSLPQLVRGVGQEAVGFDFHVTLHIQRQETLRNRAACESDPDQCQTDTQTRYGLGLMGIADATSLIGNVLTIFGIK